MGKAEVGDWRLIFSDIHTERERGTFSTFPTMGSASGSTNQGVWTLGTDPSIAEATELPTACDDVDERVNLVRRFKDKGTSQLIHVAAFRMPFALILTPA